MTNALKRIIKRAVYAATRDLPEPKPQLRKIFVAMLEGLDPEVLLLCLRVAACALWDAGEEDSAQKLSKLYDKIKWKVR